MKTKIIRLTVAIFSTTIFMVFMLYRPIQIKVDVAKSEKRTIRIPTKIEQVAATISESNVEIKTESPKFEIYKDSQYIDSYLDLDSTDNGNITAPVIDYKKIYSKILYPASMKRKNAEAFFQVRIFVNKNGNLSFSIPDNIEKAFADSVTRAFKNITVQPALLDGKPIDVTFTIPIQFSLF